MPTWHCAVRQSLFVWVCGCVHVCLRQTRSTKRVLEHKCEIKEATKVREKEGDGWTGEFSSSHLLPLFACGRSSSLGHHLMDRSHMHLMAIKKKMAGPLPWRWYVKSVVGEQRREPEVKEILGRGREGEGVYRDDDRWRDNETKISTNVTFWMFSLLFAYSNSSW